METLDLMTITDIAIALKRRPKTVYFYVESQYIPPKIVLKIGNGIRIKRADFEKWVSSLRRRY